MKLSFFGATRRVTGANFLLESSGKKILIDCGLFQGSSADKGKNMEAFNFDPKNIDALIATHSHIDHIGRIPKLIKEGFGGSIFSTEPVKKFAQIFLDNTYELMSKECRRRGVPALWSRNDLNKTMTLWQGLPYHQRFSIGEIEIEFFDAGHILGSAIVRIKAEGKVIVFSGDIGNPPVPLLRPTETIEGADYIIVESTYGDRLHEDPEQRKIKLQRTIEDIIERKGVLLIPAFAMERTQELLYEINELAENHKIKNIPIFVDSPLAIKATEIYRDYENYFNQEERYLIYSGDDIFNFPGLKLTLTPQESKAIINVPPPKIIIAGSGMSSGGRIIHHEKLYLSDFETIVLFIGFQVKGTLGRQIRDGAKKVKIDGDQVAISAEVREISGYSAHADQNKIVEWLKATKDKSPNLKKIFMVHGEIEPINILSKRIEKDLGTKTYTPEEKEIVTV